MTVSKHLFRKTLNVPERETRSLNWPSHRKRGKKALPAMLELTPAPPYAWISSDSQL
jgi:hypothetical protein